LKAIEKPKQVITVTGESLPNLRKGSYRDAEYIYSNTDFIKANVVAWNKTDRVILFKNGSIIEFISNLDEQSAKNGKRDILFVNEANGISWAIFWQLAIRTRGQIFLDYNPTTHFWAHEKLIGTTPESNDLSATVQLIISDHRHNTFLTAEDHAKIEGIKDKELWNVYARGRTGNLTGLIFPEWRMIPNDQFPKDVQFVGGCDFGYTNDPTAITKVAKVGNNLYVDELSYQAGLAPVQIKQILLSAGFESFNMVFCDHDPEMIRELRVLGVQAVAAKKGQGSINAGITRLKQMNVFYTERSKNLHIEKTRYMWAKDPVTGLSTNVPIDAFCHCMDSIRYSQSMVGQSY
jgi:phage terminase large subunit